MQNGILGGKRTLSHQLKRKHAGTPLLLPLVYHKTGENPSPSFFWSGPLFGGIPLVKCMLNLCGQAVRKKFHLPHLTQDKALFSCKYPGFWGCVLSRIQAIFVLFSKNSAACLHKRGPWWKRGKAENRMGQGVFHSFHRVFHIPRWKWWLPGAGLWKSGVFLVSKKEFSCMV